MTMPPRMTRVGDLERRDHYHLPADATSYFWGEYTPYEHTEGKKWNYSPTNQLMSNLKKKMDRQGQYDWKYKREAIETVGRQFAQFWKWKELQEKHRVALVPIPPSRARGDAMFDPRMLEIAQVIAARSGVALDIRDCLSFSGKYGPSHESDERPTPDQLFADLTFDPAVGRQDSPTGVIFLLDDMLTTGAHSVAVRRKLGEVFPGVQMVSLFVARRRLPNPFDDFEEL